MGIGHLIQPIEAMAGKVRAQNEIDTLFHSRTHTAAMSSFLDVSEHNSYYRSLLSSADVATPI
jgi:hypothetical protein